MWPWPYKRRESPTLLFELMSGLEPRGFVWVISNRLAVSERIGGYGFQHRRVRRSEEIVWLLEAGITSVLSLLPGNQNLAAYESARLAIGTKPLEGELDIDIASEVHLAIDEMLAEPGAVVLVHRDTVDDEVAGLLCGYLIHAGLIDDPIVAISIIQEIIGRPLGPLGRRLLPEPEPDPAAKGKGG